MGISISNATSSAITKYSESLRSGEPDWSMIPSAGKSNKSQAEFVSEIKELAQRAANTTSKTELESIHRQRTRLCAEYISDVSPDRKALYQQAKNAVKSQNGNPKCKGIGELSLLDFLERAEGKNNNLAQKKFALAGGGTLEWGCERTPAEREKEREFYGIYFNEYHTQKNAQSSELKELPNYLEEKTSFDRKA